MNHRPTISFGIIVLNGEPFTRYNLRALYPFAHQIIVAEGACPGARRVARKDGHSRDGTLEALRRFAAEEDPDGKVVIVTAEDEGHADGFWPGEKDEQSQAYARRATGDYLWQIDIDEFYRPEDMTAVIDMLIGSAQHSRPSGACFRTLTFWGGFDHLVDGPYLRYERGLSTYKRVFRWGEGFRYVTHRPPTVVDTDGRSMEKLNWIHGRTLARRGIFMYHYSQVFPKQVREKSRYYARANWSARRRVLLWARRMFGELRYPLLAQQVYHYPAWIEPYAGDHPPQIQALRHDIATGALKIAVRRQDDIRQLMAARWYRMSRAALRCFCWIYWPWFAFIRLQYVRCRIMLTQPRQGMKLAKFRIRAWWTGKPWG